MLKVLIVDDDSVARTSIKNLLDWNSHGYTICGEAKNGREALEMVKSLTPDIVITDISMPIMGGIEFIECLEEKYPHIKKLVLSGFDNYEYIRKSMKNNATDYILKHIVDEKTMLEVLEEISKGLIKDEMLEKQMIESRTVLKQRFFNQLVSGTINELNEIKEKIESLNIPLDTRDLIIILFELDDFLLLQEKFTAKETEKLIASVEDICDEVLKSFEKSASCHLEGGKFLIMLSFHNSRSELFIYNLIASIVDRIKVSIKRYLNVTACFSYSTVFNDITETAKNYRKVEDMLKERFYKGKNSIIRDRIEELSRKEQVNLSLSDEKAVIVALKSLDFTKVTDHVESIFEKIKHENYSYNSIQMICAELINIANRIAREAGIDMGQIYDSVPYTEMKRLETLGEVKDWIIERYQKLILILKEAKLNAHYSKYTKKAISYILQNFSKNISLNDVAQYIGVNSSYFSRVFKEDTGMGFVEYLNTTRIENAKQAIKAGNSKLKEIALDVGFNNYTYFTKVFKDVLNMTPQEYEKKVMM